SSPAGAPPAPRRAAPRVTVPLAEIVYVRAAPAYVQQLSVHVGDDADGDLLSVAAGPPVVDGSVGPDVKGLVKPGQKVSIVSEATGAHAAGTVESIADRPTKPHKGDEQAGDTDADTYALRVRPSGRLPVDLLGEDVRLTITAASSRHAVPAVPTTAISAGADGQTTVTVREGGQERRVVVETGMTADGYVQVTPRRHGALSVGDRVVVGVDERPAPETP
ncbi:peptidoglycan-binding protein, partial [Streptomyces sp. GXMU-J5]|nr:peptidoglycan-binding protein [Streptomyces beihaiensis]